MNTSPDAAPTSATKNLAEPSGASPTPQRHAAQRGAAWPWLLALVVVLVAGGWWWWKARGADGAAAAQQSSGATGGPPGAGGAAARRFGAANRVQPVSVQAARRQDIRITVNAIGSITASNTATVRAQVSGVLQSLNFKEGQQVKAGQVLAQIDPRAFQATLGQAEGTLARDRAQLENARIDLTRYRDLLAKDAIAKQQLDTQEALVRQLEGTVRSDQATVDSARLSLSYTRVVAPIPGRVGLKQADLGNLVQANDTNGLVTITQTRPIALVFAVPSAHLPQITAKLRANEPLPVEAWDRSGATRLAVGKLATIDNAIDASTDTIKLKAVFANDDDALFPNQSVSVRLQLDTLVDTLVVPPSAVLRGAQGFYLYVVNADSSVNTRVVQTGAVDGDWMAVTGPLQPGEKVVIDGVDRLRDGAKVEVIAADPKQRAGANAPAGGPRRGPRGPDGAGSAAGYSAGGAASASNGTAKSAAPAGGPASGGASRPMSAAPADATPTPGGATPAMAADSSAPDRPPWLDRLPPDVQEKVMKMSPDERREWIQKRREERAKNGAPPRESSN